MAHFVLNYSFIILIFYSNVFKSAIPKTVDDSWLWPNEIDSENDERPLIMAQKLIYPSSVDADMSMWQSKRPELVYPDSSLPVLQNDRLQIRRNSSAWKKLKIKTEKLSSLQIKPTKSNHFDVSKNSDSGTDKSQTSPAKDWIFPEDNLIKRKAEMKCAKYNKAIENRDVWIHPLVGNWPATPSPEKTGSKQCKGIQNPLIIGGAAAWPGEFSHMAALGWISPENKTSFLCGGSLISHRWVITAAHCTHGPSGPPKVVRLGTHHLSDKAAGKLIRIREIVRHPFYKPPAIYADLALLQLDKAVNFGSEIRPACLYTEFDTTPVQAWATGWGATGIGEEQSEELLKVRLDVVDNVVCALRLNRSAAIPRGIVPSMLCAGDVSGNWQSDTCQGDSGGPLQVSHPNHKCLHQIIGVTSFGRMCALKDSPGVYTRISHYIDWIESIAWPSNNR